MVEGRHRLSGLSRAVKSVLEEHKDARDNDSVMYWYLINKIGKNHGLDASKLSVYSVLHDYRRLGLPSLESAGRARRKVQRSFPDLCGSKDASAIRAESEEEYKDFANDYLRC